MSAGEKRAEAEALVVMKARGGTWAAYENQDLSSADAGRLQFLQFGEGRTFATPPACMPDSPAGLGCRYRYVGATWGRPNPGVGLVLAAPEDSR